MNATTPAGSISPIVKVTRHPPRLGVLSEEPGGQQLIYQVGLPFQLSPTQAGLLLNIRLGRTRVVDLEMGADLVLFDDPDRIGADGAVALIRSWDQKHPRTGDDLLMVSSLPTGGFVPLGARRADGSPHPHAGTGFGLSAAHGYPLKLAQQEDTHLDVKSDIFGQLELMQFAFDGRTFRVTERRRLDLDELLPGHQVQFLALGAAIPSRDDLLSGITTGSFGAQNAGVARWSRGRDGRWAIIEHQVLAENVCEPSIVRDTDGSILLAFRPWGPTTTEPDRLHIQRSTDEGRTWERLCVVEPFWQMCPITINRAADGRPYVCANRFREPRQQRLATREMLWAWPLSDDRQSLLGPVLVRDGPGEWGPTPNGSVWRMDHPLGQTLRLADGQWRHLLCYRVLDDAEMRTDAGATDRTGCYVEEVISAGPPLPPWRF